MKKEKINPIMGSQKTVKKIKMKENHDTEDENVVKKFIIITIVIAVLIAIVYGVTELIKGKEETKKSEISGKINYDKASVGTILNRPYEEYYVLVYSADNNDAVLYSTMLTKYMKNKENKDYVKIYFCDLANSLNSSYYNVGNDNKSNPDAKTTKEFDFGDLTLIKVKNNKISKYIEDLDEIKKILQ